MKLKKVKVFGKYIFYYLADDKYVGQRISLEKYEPYETDLILRQASAIGGRAGSVIVDVGANIGYYTVLLAQKAKKVYAFEPDKINFEILKKNIEANKLTNVVAIMAAVGSKKGSLELYKSEENFGDHKLFKTPLVPQRRDASPFDEGETVNIIKLDDLIKEKVDLIKIDTQGWEPEVVEGARKIIEKDRPIIFMEYSPASYKQAKLDGQKMMKNLRKIYPKIWWIDEWLYIYKNLSQKRIDQICRTNKTSYADLWMKKETTIKDYFDGFLNFKIKKFIKKIIYGIN